MSQSFMQRANFLVKNLPVAVMLALLLVLPQSSPPLAITSELSLDEHLYIQPPTKLPANGKAVLPPELSAESGMVVDVDSAWIMWEKSMHQRYPIASLTKLMTALVAIDIYDLDDVLSVPEQAFEGSVMGLETGEQVKVENLLWGLLLNSGNDAATVLAVNSPGGEKDFVAQMNQKARDMGLTSTSFTSPVGWDDTDHYSTVADLAVLARYVLRQPLLMNIVNTSHTVVVSASVDEIEESLSPKRWYHLRNTNPLLGEVLGVQGMKTGYTELAGECLITYVDRGGRELLVVLLGSEDREMETKELIEWGYEAWEW